MSTAKVEVHYKNIKLITQIIRHINEGIFISE